MAWTLLKRLFSFVMQLRWEHAGRYIQGQLLDVGCGSNGLVRRYRVRSGQFGYGVDMHSWPGVDVVCDAQQLPFRPASFETIALIACLNHIADRRTALRECWYVLKPGGRLILTMINPIVGVFVHTLFYPIDEARHRHIVPGERQGLWDSAVRVLVHDAGFTGLQVHPFALGLNRVYVAHKPAVESQPSPALVNV